MKRCIAILTLIVVVLSTAACGKQDKVQPGTNQEELKHHEIVTEATEQLKKYWKQEYQDTKNNNTDGYFEIKNTRVITMKDNDIELFQDVAYIIEYELYTDYMGSAPYYENCGVNNNVVVYKNGTMDVASNLIRLYRNKTFQTDYSGFIEAIDDYHGQYNCTEKLK